MSSSTPEWFTNQEFAHIKARALHYAFKLKRRLLQSESVKDLQQDLLVAVVEAWKSFDRENARLEPFIEEILKHASISLVRSRLRQKREVAQFSVSLDDVPENLLSDKEDNWVEEIEQKVDVERYLRKSPVFLRKLMVEIQNDSLRNVAQKFGMTRGKLRGVVEHCRRALAPLEEFVNGEDFLGLRIRRCLCA